MCVYVGLCASVHVLSVLFLSMALHAQDWSGPVNCITQLKVITALPATAMFQQVACPLLKSSDNLPIYNFQLGLFP